MIPDAESAVEELAYYRKYADHFFVREIGRTLVTLKRLRKFLRSARRRKLGVVAFDAVCAS
jgi:hypothetical protein